MPEAEPGQYVGRLDICPVGRSQTNHGEEHPNSQQTHQQWHLVPTPFVCGRDDSGKRIDITALLHFTRDVIRAAVSTTHLCSDKTISFTGIQDEEDCFNSIQFNSKQFIAEKIQQIHTVHYLPTIHFQGNGDWTPAGVCVP